MRLYEVVSPVETPLMASLQIQYYLNQDVKDKKDVKENNLYNPFNLSNPGSDKKRLRNKSAMTVKQNAMTVINKTYFLKLNKYKYFARVK